MATTRRPARLLNVMRTLTGVARALKNDETSREDSLMRLESSVRHSRIAVLITDRHSRYVGANPAATALTGYSRRELLTLGIWNLAPAADERDVDRLWRGFLQTREQLGEFRLRRKSGRIVTARYVARANLLPGIHVSVLVRTPAGKVMTQGTVLAGDTARSPMAKKTGNSKDQKKRSQGTQRGGQTNQYRGKSSAGSIGSHKPGGDGPGTKKWTKE